MPSDPANTILAIERSAKDEFLAHGFAGASMRKIAAGAGVTTGALYSHFADKETLFTSLVEPVYTEVIGKFKQQGDEITSLLDAAGPDSMWDATRNALEFFVRYIYERYDAFKLLISASEQTVYENFTHQLVQLDVDMTLAYIGRARTAGYAVKDLSEGEIHLLSSAQYSAIFEIVLHDLSGEEALRYADTIWEFFSSGWRKLFGVA
jgi:AcrR family transcriptional regulator